MGEIVQYLLNGLTLGGIYALLALGLYIMWEASKAANFTHGDIYMLGAVVAVVLTERGLPLFVSIIASVAIAAVVGALIERFFVRPFNTEPHSIGWMLTTIAVGMMIESAATQTYGSLGRQLPSVLAEKPIRLGGAGVYAQELLLPIAAIATMFGLQVFYRRTRLGRAMRAVAADRMAAGLMGIDSNLVALIAFALAAGIGALTGILIAPVLPALPTMGALTGLKAFGVAIVAGISSARGVVIVGLAYGVMEKFIEGYLSTGARDALGFSLVILALLVFPQGIFGRGEVKKV
ncbi:branched-chain amino acid ABC transporter permease [Bradyrhizobium manausense]|uniref:branched-chain amino acid ABC transporter permease n=1 Tax=Bradyrhizobium manausense TaxID=989370 RepID=UPI001BAB58F5|nr:branched-chain amino acid ABC transporter permease [Bradyrhizobium manausense]MBR0687849.1 branched-chain amino acid ABC transporter permease [Bradyrhizobium manausense]